MKIKSLLAALVISITAVVSQGQDIRLPQPRLSEEATLKSALENRCSQREYDNTREINPLELSNLLWAGWGYNREDKRTAPSALDRQEITLYVCMKDGVYRYDAEANGLIQITDKNIMGLTGKQSFVESAAINIIYVCNKELSSSRSMSMVCCGAISQNISLYCASTGLATVVRGAFDADTLRTALKLSPNHEVLLTQSVGYQATK